VPIRDNTVTLSNQPYGSGYYAVSTSSTAATASSAFDHRITLWTSGNRYTSYIGAPQSLITHIYTYVNGVHLRGHWLQLQIPTPIYLHSYTITTSLATSVSKVPYSFYMLGSTDGKKWEVVHYVTEESGWNRTAWSSKTYMITEYRRQLSYYRLVVTLAGMKGASQTCQVDLMELILNGSPGMFFFFLITFTILEPTNMITSIGFYYRDFI
jgi:hypothetical protein